MTLRSSAALIIFSLFSSFCFAQSSSASAPTTPPHPAAFHDQSELVIVPVVVKKDGVHVPGLTKGDFRLEQDGKEQKITVFDEVTHAAAATAEAGPATPGEVTNYSVLDTHARRVLIVVIDVVNTPYRDQQVAKDALINLLARELPKDEPIALFAIDEHGLMQLHAFTTETRILLAALQEVASSGAAKSENPHPGPSTGESSLRSADIREEALTISHWKSKATSFLNSDAVSSTMVAMQQIAGAFAGVPGRKTMIWATDGLPFAMRHPYTRGPDTEMVENHTSTWRLLNSANIAVYPVKLDGLRTDHLFFNQRLSPWLRNNPELLKSLNPEGDRERNSGLLSFANKTGGKAYINTNDVGLGFAEAARDSDSYYLLGYYIPRNSKVVWHQLKVRALTPHSEVRAREGFFSGVPANTDEAKNREFNVALSSPVDYTGIHFSMTLEPQRHSEPPEAKRTARFRLLVPANAITIDRQRAFIDLDLEAVAINKQGQAAGETGINKSASLQPELLGDILRTGITMNASIQVSPGEYELRVALRDNLNGNLGTLRTKLVVN